MEQMFESFDFAPMVAHSVWLMLTYVAVLAAMVVDLVSGVRKARRAGVARTSTGFKKTCDKAIKYFFPMLCLTCIDLIASGVEPLPFLTMAMAAFNIFCEWRSVMEATHEKEELRRAERTMSIILENKDELAEALGKLIREHMKDNSQCTMQDAQLESDESDR